MKNTEKLKQDKKSFNLEESKDVVENREILSNEEEDREWELLSTDTYDTEVISGEDRNEDEKIKEGFFLYEKLISGEKQRDQEKYPEIIPGYGSDSSTEETYNTIGNISLEKYENFPHIGYDINGKKIMRPMTKTALDTLLNTIEDKEGWTGVIDKDTGEDIRLTSEELEIVKKIQEMEIPDDGFDPYEMYVDYFSGKQEKTPLSCAPEPKRRFIPSKNERKRIMKIVQAIRAGRIVLDKPKKGIRQPLFYDIWSDTSLKPYDHIMHIPAPKISLPTHDESYNPPEEYLPSEDEINKWNNTSYEDREKKYLPSKYKSLRLVPGYNQFIQERFERCLDLYLAPRIRKNRLNIDPESLIPKLPLLEDLRPFPTKCMIIYKGHKGPVHSIDVDSTGTWLASGGDDGIVRIWEIITGREIWNFNCNNNNESINSIAWRPVKNSDIIIASCGNNIYILLPSIFNDSIKDSAKEFCNLGFDIEKSQMKQNLAKWLKPDFKQIDKGLLVLLNTKKSIKQVTWHRNGDYFATVLPESGNTSVLVHLLSKHQSQSPFKKVKGIIQKVEFHPTKPLFFVATQRYVKVYNLIKQELIKIIQPGVKWISSIDIHPQGDNVIIGSYDKKLVWVDMDLSSRPYKTLCYHAKALKSVKFHKGQYPLFCSTSDDGTIQVFHGMVYSDLMENALLVPLKILKGHEIKNSLGVFNAQWHPKQPWLFSCGVDATIRLWT
ncbi:hypothetical protein T552_01833 [Pneumocystis carinii B80]|uniref:Ribosome biogenesis protein ERB1 n=1 Tax=Pneumocystis carinii (strain B80) TaxID=1408658 RepID=A0A0W4ZJL1_PNEC8|nr:hypothetical protein T552_01833 [Pneumocystis carinii B80]KTW28572.1 hypothetical protein T552_01833 [Pneumocystis carinii B80]